MVAVAVDKLAYVLRTFVKLLQNLLLQENGV